jgi:TolB-like protein
MSVGSRVVLVLSAGLPLLAAPLLVGQGAPEDGQRYRVAVVPFETTGGKRQTQDLVEPAVATVFRERGFDVVYGQPVLDAIDAVTGYKGMGPCVRGLVPSLALIKIGARLEVRYVVAGSLDIVSKRTMHIMGPRAKAECTLATRIVDVQAGEMVFSTEAGRESKANTTAQSIVGAALSYPAGFLLGGKTGDQEKKALAKAIDQVYEGFFTGLAR